MKKKKIGKKFLGILLTIAMIVPIFQESSNEVHAAELPTVSQFATKEQLLNDFDTRSDTTKDDGTQNEAKVYFGNNDQQWLIAGSQNDDSMVLFAASSLGPRPRQFESSINDKTYRDDWDCDYISTGSSKPTTVYSNHYGATSLRTILRGLESSDFTSKEQALMKDTIIYTHDTKNGKVYSTTDKLYLAYGKYGETHITVGANSSGDLNDGLRVDRSYWYNYFSNSKFWLRAPYIDAQLVNNGVLIASPLKVDKSSVIDSCDLVPAFELNLSSVLFASAAPAASYDGLLQENEAFTLRYSANNLGSALVSYDKSTVNLSNVPNGTYLVAQNSEGAYAKQITNETSVSASDLRLNSFANCKVWLETTDANERMTYATLATEEHDYTVNVENNTGLKITSQNSSQVVKPRSPINDIIVEAEKGYFFPSNYRVSETNGLSIQMKSDTEFVISGTPTADVNITLNPATKWEEPQISTSQYATKEQLMMLYDTNDNTQFLTGQKVYFGSNNQQWWIAGNDTNSPNTDNIVLFAASPLATGKPFEPNWENNKTYRDDWKCDYANNPTEVYSNHYGASPLRTTLRGLESSYFTSVEQDLMEDTKIYTNDTRNGNVYSTTNKLYLAYGDYNDDQYITVGTNSEGKLNNDDLRIDKSYWGTSDFWLRAPYGNYSSEALLAWADNYVRNNDVYIEYALVPAFELNLSSVLFASAAPVASSDRKLDFSEAMTLRYQGNIGNATISQLKQNVAITGVDEAKDTYLVVQNSNGAWAKKVSNNDLISSNEIDSSLTSFDNCKVWLETTEDRITYANEATQADGHSVIVNAGQNMTITNNIQTSVTGAISNITVSATIGYYFTDDYVTNLNTLLSNLGLIAQKTNDYTLTISGTPTSDVLLTLPNAAIKKYIVTYIADGNEIDKQTIEHGSNAVAPNIPHKVGYDQVTPYWDHDGLNITADTEITAQYTINTYTVTYIADGNEISKQTIEHGSNAVAPNIPHKVGYDQVTPKWNHDGKNITKDTTIEAIYTINKYQVTVPTTQIGYELTSEDSIVEHGGQTTLTYSLKEGYTETKDFAIKVNGNEVTLTNGTYIVDEIKGDIEVTVEGIADVTKPTAEIEVGTNIWNSFLNDITFGNFFKERQEVTITANDTGSGIKDISYFLSDKELSEDELNDIADWTLYTKAFDIDPDNNYVIYVKVTDNAGNCAYINSDGIVLDATKPVIPDIENDEEYFGNVVIDLSEEEGSKLFVDEEEVELTNGKYQIPADNQEHTILIVDKAGNENEFTITVYKNYTVSYKVDGAIINTQIIGYGKDTVAPIIPTKVGYTETAPYWSHNGQNIQEDMVIEAIYTKDKVVDTEDENPKTGDTTQPMMWIAAMIISLLGVITIKKINQKQKHHS